MMHSSQAYVDCVAGHHLLLHAVWQAASDAHSLVANAVQRIVSCQWMLLELVKLAMKAGDILLDFQIVISPV
jgi:hypothetical protein